MTIRSGILALATIAAFTAPSFGHTYIAYGSNPDAKVCYEAAMMSTPSYEALRACDAALKHESLTRDQKAGVLVNRGILKFEQGDFNGAYKDYKTALNINPNLAEGYANRGTVFFIAERFDEALADYDRALELQPDNELPVRLNRAMVLHALGRAEDAEADYLRVLEISEDPEAAREKMRAFKSELRAS